MDSIAGKMESFLVNGSYSSMDRIGSCVNEYYILRSLFPYILQ